MTSRAAPRVIALALAFLAASRAASAQDTAPPADEDRPFVPGGFDDKPYVHGVFGRILLGGYLEADAFVEREDGVVGESGFEVKRWNLLASTKASRHVTIWSEVEFEEGGEEITLELVQVDVAFRRAVNLRGGILLLPLGRFNLTHDAPRNELPTRPLVASDLLGVALSQPGFGLFGRRSWSEGARLTYEAYAVNGFRDGVIFDSPGGTRLPAGKLNFEDENSSPAFVGRIAFSPRAGYELGVSGHHGAYNVFREEGVDVDERRDVTIAALDGEARVASIVLSGEAVLVDLDIPPGLSGLYASRQSGFYAEASRPFGHGWVAAWPASYFTAAVRADAVDFDRDRPGDSERALSLGVNLRPTKETALKLAWARSRARDRFNNRGEGAAVRFSVATYF